MKRVMYINYLWGGRRQKQLNKKNTNVIEEDKNIISHQLIYKGRLHLLYKQLLHTTV